MSERDERRIALERISHHLGTDAGRDVTVTDRIFAIIRQAIAELVLKPSETLSEKELATMLGVSKTPVREALIRLSMEGLVSTLPRSGTHVTPIDPEDLFEAMVIREALETTAVRLAARRADGRSKFLLKETMVRQNEVLLAGDAMAFHRADDDFHHAIVTASGLRRLWSLLEPVRVTLSRVRHIAAPIPGRIETLIIQHQEIVDAILANDSQAAVCSMRTHLEALYPFVEALLRDRPDLFGTQARPHKRRSETAHA
jgi:DNA-binding GntR family transcriptional regulator